MVEINSGIICNIILKAREINIADDLTMNSDHIDISDTEWKQILAEYQDDDSYIELKSLINDLEPDQQQQIIALMYLGRGDFKENEWRLAMEQALTIPIPSRADYLISKTMLADYLEEGLAMLGYSCDE
jgi:3-phenylpropionate/cinnamic acid dioxygenase small subunit